MGAGWSFDEDAAEHGRADGSEPAEVEPDVLEGDRRPRRTRRGLLLGGAALLAGGTAWALSTDASAPAPTPRAAPDSAGPRISGPKPLWTYRSDGLLDLARLDAPPRRPLVLTDQELTVLAPANGTPVRRFTPPEKVDLLTAGSLLLAGGAPGLGMLSDRISGYDLATGSTDWQFALPAAPDDPTRPVESPGGATRSLVARACDETTVYCSTEVYTLNNITGRFFAVSLLTRQVRWEQSQQLGEMYDVVHPIEGGRLLVSMGPRLSLLDGRDGRRLWITDRLADTVVQRAVDDQRSYEVLADGGVLARSLADGTEKWRLAPHPGSGDRYLRPLPSGGRLYLFTDGGRVTAVDTADATARWEHQLPFRLDVRSRPVLAGDLLLVPGPTKDGVVALAAHQGTVRWTFQDGEPGVDVWAVAADDQHAYLGHDHALHAVPLA
ncbi:PQQ-binding-like beta-propeller repeat protein [Kitasatospora azatica]|uniref:PQQ-binding-like beta-propeller repeat protein n=1 Tax=Kitasatospora azatica TaxID=58347 RepID=UPI000564C0E5|nr:PQQ-binding-like beta-propeller repeat protein [Kitasatospora azatica]